MRKIALMLHRWVGLSLAIIAVLSGVTGAALVFRPEIEARADSQLLLTAAPSSAPRQAAPLQQALDGVHEKFEGCKVQHIFMAREANHAHVVWFKWNEEDWRAFVDPATGAQLGSRRAGEHWIEKLAEIHIRLLSGEAGHNVIGWGGVALFAMSLSGLSLWWPRRAQWKRALRPNLKNPRGRNYELHRVCGALVAPFLLLSSLTGIALVWPDTAQMVLKPIFGQSAKTKHRAQAGASLALDELVTRANAGFPDGVVRRISFPLKPGAPLVIRKRRAAELHPNGMNYIYLEAATGRVLGIDDASRAPWGVRLMNARYPVHIGLWGGTATRVLFVFIGLAPLALFCSGLVLWNNRRKKHNRNRPYSAKAQLPTTGKSVS